MSSQNPKRAMFEHLAAVARSLGSAHRLELLELLAQTERSVEELAGLSGLTIANASQHLQQLRRSGLVETRRDGKRVLYRLADGDVVALLGVLRRITERNVGAVEKVLNSYFRERDSLEAVSRKELLRRMRACHSDRYPSGRRIRRGSSAPRPQCAASRTQAPVTGT